MNSPSILPDVIGTQRLLPNGPNPMSIGESTAARKVKRCFKTGAAEMVVILLSIGRDNAAANNEVIKASQSPKIY